MHIDYIITYINNKDFNWITKYVDECQNSKKKIELVSSRYRDSGLLKYHLRSVEKYLPWVRNVYLVVSEESQVPCWINKNNVKIILHKDIIPIQYRPTFNSTTIEMFLHHIPDLSENFIYANDDVIPNNYLTQNDFFDVYYDMKPRLYINNISSDKINIIYESQLNNAKIMILNLLNLQNDNKILISDHSLFSFKKSTFIKLWKTNRNILIRSLSPFRERYNLSPNVFNFYHYFKNDYSFMNRNNKYFNLKENNLNEIKEAINNKNIDVLCLNDNNNISNEYFDDYIKELQKTYNNKLPNKCKYEL